MSDLSAAVQYLQSVGQVCQANSSGKLRASKAGLWSSQQAASFANFRFSLCASRAAVTGADEFAGRVTERLQQLHPQADRDLVYLCGNPAMVDEVFEQLKAIALVDWTSAILAPSTITEFCVPASDTCTMAPQPGAYRRATTIGEVTAGLCAIPCKLVHVTVFYQPLSSTGQFDQERRVDIVTLLAARA